MHELLNFGEINCYFQIHILKKEFKNILICGLTFLSVLILIQVGGVKASTSVQKENLCTKQESLAFLSLTAPTMCFL